MQIRSAVLELLHAHGCQHTLLSRVEVEFGARAMKSHAFYRVATPTNSKLRSSVQLVLAAKFPDNQAFGPAVTRCVFWTQHNT
jgi:hypothetical protein